MPDIEQRPSLEAVQPLRVLMWVLTSLGITGLLCVAGYVVELSSADFLGVAPSLATVSDYLPPAAEFLTFLFRDIVEVLEDLLDVPRSEPWARLQRHCSG